MTAFQPFAPGDIFVTASDLDATARFPTGKGKILQFAADWTPKATVETGHTGLISSLTLDQAGNLHALDPQARKISSFAPNGAPVTMFAKLPERAYGSMIALDDGHFLFGEHMVGQVPGFSGDGNVYRVNADGEVLATYDTETNGGMGGFLGVTHLALSANGTILYHVSETGPHVYGHDLAADKRLGPIYTRADPPPMVFGLAAQSDGSLLLAAGNGIRQISSTGEVVRHYDMPEGRGWAVIIPRADGLHFWALDFFGGRLARVETLGGKATELRELGLTQCLAGLAEVPSA